ncbi:MAG: tryptophan synthase subunit alpha [Planctomycetes bacterium]|nr:tryptophan synthase subunit alpha [Planctomycetota bacterium]
MPKKLIPYLTAGYPDSAGFLELLRVAEEQADALEIGLPFSDPVADGPVIQRSSQSALANGMNLPRLFTLLKRVRPQRPLHLMSYLNPLLRPGLDERLRTLARLGFRSLMIPDLPLEESGFLMNRVAKHGLSLTPFLSLETRPARARRILESPAESIYLISVRGTTGIRARFSGETIDFIRTIRGRTEKELLLGFGISAPEQVRQVAPHVDGVIVGSALIDLIDRSRGNLPAITQFLNRLRKGLSREHRHPA